jgi:hypothetical protein
MLGAAVAGERIHVKRSPSSDTPDGTAVEGASMIREATLAKSRAACASSTGCDAAHSS